MPIPAHWLWQRPGWPKLVFDDGALNPALSRARHAQGRVLGKAHALGLANLDAALADIWVEEAVATARIEGEKLDLAAVRSSVARRLGMTMAGSRSRTVEGLMDLMEDATARWQEPLTLERLCGWQAALFPVGHSGIHRIVVGALRSGPEPMQIVSGPITRPKVHYEAPPAKRLPREVRRFLEWFEATRTAPVDGLIRAGTAHLWFEMLHPFEDGNGRVGRAIVDLALAQDARLDQRLYSVSRRLADSRDAYYAELALASRGGLDITRWLHWFVGQFEGACSASEAVIDLSLAKARFWLEHVEAPLNDRQRKVVNRLLEAGPAGFEGGMSTSKYAHIARISRATAYRDLEELVRHRLLAQKGTGRGTRYSIAMDGW
jgi:Fic family protein